MAIYHLSASIVKRSAGRSVTAAAAYRAAAKIEDITTGLVHDYTRKKGVDYSEILSPISTSLGNEWLTDRQELWNKIEEVERRKDAQLAREITLAIPRELSRPEQIALVREYVQTNYVAAGMVADVNLHHLDGDNPHAHILLTMRNLQTTPKGIVEFGLKNTDWNSKDLLLTHRKSWEEITNKYLANYGSDLKIDCRSLKEQGSEFIPQIHVGVHAMAMHRKGKQTDRRDEFERIEAANNHIRARLEEIYEQEYTEPELELNEADNERKEKDHRLAELIIEAMKHNPYPRCEREADRAKQGLGRDHTRFDSSHSKWYYSVVLKTKKNIESIEITIGGARPRLFTFEKENSKWIKKTFYHKTAFPEIFYPNPFLKDQIDYAIANFNENTIDRYYHKLQRVRLEDEQLQLKENKLGKLIIDLSEKLQSERFYIEPYYIYAGKDEILIGKRRSSLYYPSPFELKSDGHGNFAREYIQHDRDNESVINYFTEIITNYRNELEQEEYNDHEVNISNSSEEASLKLDLGIAENEQAKTVVKSYQLPKTVISPIDDNSVDRIKTIHERVIAREQEKPVDLQVVKPLPVESVRAKIYIPTRLELARWYEAATEAQRLEIAIIGQRLKATYMAQPLMRGKPVPNQLPDSYCCESVSISFADKERFDRALSDLPQVIEPVQVEEKLAVSKPVPIEEELAVSEPKEIDLELQVVEEEQIKEVTKVPQPTRKITKKKKHDRGR